MLSPFVLVAVAIAVLALRTDPHWPLTTAVTVLFVAVVPQSISMVMVKLGAATDKFIRRREQRHRFYGLALVSVTVGGIAAFLMPASHHVQMALLWTVGTLVVVAVINLGIKISVHALTASLAGIIVAGAESWAWLLVAVPVTALVSWARVYQRRHTIVEVVLGATLGFAVGCAFWMIVGAPPSR